MPSLLCFEQNNAVMVAGCHVLTKLDQTRILCKTPRVQAAGPIIKGPQTSLAAQTLSRLSCAAPNGAAGHRRLSSMSLPSGP